MNTFKGRRLALENKILYLKERIRWALKEYTPEKRKELLEFQFRLTNAKGKLKFIRPETKKDTDYRSNQIYTFVKKMKEALPESEQLIFHGTPIYNAEKILKSGRIVSGKDLWGFSTSGDPKGKFSVTTKDFLDVTIQGYSDLNMIPSYLPAGVIFVLKTKDASEYQMAKEECYMKNVNFKKNPEKLYALITTPENIKRVQGWLDEGQYQAPLFDYDGFVKHIQNKNSTIKFNSNLQSQISY